MIVFLLILSLLVFLLLLVLTLLTVHSVWGWPSLGKTAPSASSFTLVKESLDDLGLKSDYIYLNDEKSEARFFFTYNEMSFTVDALLRPGSRAVCLAQPSVLDTSMAFAQDALMACNMFNRRKGLRYRAVVSQYEGPAAEGKQEPSFRISLIATHEMTEARSSDRAARLLDMLREGLRCRESLLGELSEALDAAKRRLEEAETAQDYEAHDDQMRMQAILDFLDPHHTLS